MLPFPRNLKLVQGPYSLSLQQLLMDVGTTQRGTHAPSIPGGALFHVCVPPALAHFVRLIYVGKTNESELRFLNSTVRLKKKHFLLTEHSEQDLFEHIKLEKNFY